MLPVQAMMYAGLEIHTVYTSAVMASQVVTKFHAERAQLHILFEINPFHTLIPFQGSFLYYTLTYAFVLQVVTFIQVCSGMPTEAFEFLFPPMCVIPPISYSLFFYTNIWSRAQFIKLIMCLP
jgi:hypothetical protein